MSALPSNKTDNAILNNWNVQVDKKRRCLTTLVQTLFHLTVRKVSLLCF